MLTAIGAGMAVLTGLGAGLGIGLATSKATEAIARQPEAEGKISKALLLGCALAEATAIYGFVIALLLLFVKLGRQVKTGAEFRLGPYLDHNYPDSSLSLTEKIPDRTDTGNHGKKKDTHRTAA